MIKLYKLSHDDYDEGAMGNVLDSRASQYRDRNFRGHTFNMYKESCK